MDLGTTRSRPWLQPDGLIERSDYPDLGDAWWDQLVRDADLAIGRRSLLGAKFFAIVAAVFVAAGAFAGQWAAAILVAPVTVTVVRAALIRDAEDQYDVNPDRWRRWLVASFLINSSSWSAFVVALVVSEGLTVVTMTALVVASGLAAGVVTTLHPNLRLLRIVLSVQSLPVFVACVSLGTGEGVILASLASIHGLYYMCSSAGVYREYWSSATSRAQLSVRDRTNTLLSTAIRRATDGIEVCDADLRVEYVNPALERMLGATADELRGRLASDVPARTEPWTGEVQGELADGTPYIHELSTWPITSSSGRIRHYVVARRDVTEQRSLQEQMQAASRDASMGVLAASIAHDINNPLTYVIGNACYVRDVLGVNAPPQLLEALDETVDGATRIASIVQDLKAMARPSDEATQVMDLADVLRIAVNIAANEVRHRARLRQDLAPMPCIEGPSAKLVMVFVNLLVNAAQSIDDGAASDNEIALITRADDDGWARVEVRDTGAGIPREQLSRVFDPFFTTKAPGGGTGLGLSICRRTIGKLGGELTIDSTVGVGTRAVVRIPPASDTSGRTPAAPEGGDAAPSRRMRVLVIDDEPPIARALRRLLSAHDVAAAASPQEVSDHLDECNFDVVLCDVMMPDGGGQQIHELIQQSCPRLAKRVIFMTGGAFTGTSKGFLERLDNPIVQKPFDADSLLDLIDQYARDDAA